MPPSAVELLQRIEALELLGDDELKRMRRAFASAEGDTSAEVLAKKLVRQGRLTQYQAAAIYQDKADSLRLGNYIIRDRIGRGGMGQVYLAEHRRLDRLVAIKVLASHLLDSQEAVRRFHREVRAAAKLDHPNVVAAYDADETSGIHFLVMEYVRGQDLASVIREQAQLPVNVALDYLRQAAQGLAYAHDKGVIHRDIKPANLLVSTDGTVKILDMGLARMQHDEGSMAGLTAAGQIMGTLDYMPPEQALDTHGVDARADIYSLGCTFFQMLTGRPPYSGSTVAEKLIAHRRDRIPSLHDFRTDVSEELESVYRRMLAKSVSDRFQDADDLLTALKNLEFEHDTSASTFVQAREENEGLHDFLNQLPVYEPDEESEAATHQSYGTLIAPDVLPNEGVVRKPPPRRRLTLWLTLGGFLLAATVASIVAFNGKRGRTRSENSQTSDNTGKDENISPLHKPADADQQTANKRTKEEHEAPDIGRQVALWTLRQDGNVSVYHHGRLINFKRVDRLPTGPLDVRHVSIESPTKWEPSLLPKLATLPHLEQLTIADAPFGDSDMKHVVRIKGLTLLRLLATKVTDQGLESIGTLQQLTTLRLADSPFTDASAVHIGKLPRLRHLFLTNTSYRGQTLSELSRGEGLLSLSLSGSPIDNDAVAQLIQLRTLTRLKIDNTMIDAKGVDQLKKLDRLRFLAVGGTKVNDELLSEIARMTLNSLEVNNTQITQTGLETLSSMASLVRLELRGATLPQVSLEPLAKLPKLISLDLTGTSTSASMLMSLTAGAKLKDLNVSDSPLTLEDISAFKASRPMVKITGKGINREVARRLLAFGVTVRGTVDKKNRAIRQRDLSTEEHLRIVGITFDKAQLTRELPTSALTHQLHLLPLLNDLRYAGVDLNDDALKQLQHLPKLASLTIGSVNLTAEGLRVLHKFPSLGRVSTSHINIGDQGFRNLCEIPGLHTLQVNFSDVTDEGLKALSQASELEHLGIRRARITDAGMESIGKLKRLSTLALDNAQITDKGMAYLAPLEQLSVLEIPYTQVGDAGLRHVINWRFLKRLDLRGTKITNASQKLLDQLGIESIDVRNTELKSNQRR